MLDLKNVTLFALDGVDSNLTAKTLQLCSSGIDFGEIELVTLTYPQYNFDGNITIIHKMDQPLSNAFMIKDLIKYVATDYVITIHTDGFIINPHLWNNEFFKYDYIGAPWYSTDHTQSKWLTEEGKKNFNYVGNGGFSFRSRKFVELSAMLPSSTIPEDTYLCNNNKEYFLDNGMRYAPVEIAKVFSQDPPPDWRSTFGFHGVRNQICCQ